jgi:hypothetical protein
VSVYNGGRLIRKEIFVAIRERIFVFINIELRELSRFLWIFAESFRRRIAVFNRKIGLKAFRTGGIYTGAFL